MWDDRAMAHAGPVDGFMFEDERIVHRTTVVGDLPCGPGSSRAPSWGTCSKHWLERHRRSS